MKTFNYRIIHTDDSEELGHEPFVSINEVYYDDNGQVSAWSEEPQYLISENTSELRKDIDLILQAFDRPILTQVGDKLIEYKEQ